MGQGLILWQGYGMYGDLALSLEKQSNVITGYASGGESNFMRGVALVRSVRNLEVNIFYNKQRLSANLENYNDGEFIRTINVTGLRQTDKDIGIRDNTGYEALGTSIRFLQNK